MNDPTVYLVIDGSAIAFDESGEVVEALRETSPAVVPYWDWPNASICDHRGGGGAEGFETLVTALTAAERNAELMGLEVRRASVPS